jgi:hypothetical protein
MARISRPGSGRDKVSDRARGHVQEFEAARDVSVQLCKVLQSEADLRAIYQQRSQVPRSTFPTMGEVYREQLQLERTAADIDAGLENNARQQLY